MMLCVLIGIGWMSVTVIPPQDLTETRMYVMKRRIIRYALTHSRLPESVAKLPLLEGYGNRVVDGWKTPIKFTVSEGSVVTLSSAGPDGEFGSGDDIVRVFRAKRVDGTWSDEFGPWEDSESSAVSSNAGVGQALREGSIIIENYNN